MHEKCRAAQRKTLTGLFGDRCGKPAVDMDWLGRPVCAECAEWIAAARRDAQAVGNVLSEIYRRRTARPKGQA